MPSNPTPFVFHRTLTCWKCRKDFPRILMTAVTLPCKLTVHQCPDCD